MNEASSIPLPAPIVGHSFPADKWQREFQAFQVLKPGLLTTHPGQYVVIHNGEVAASGPDDVALALDFFVKHGNVPVHIGLVTDLPEAVAHIPHYRHVDGGDAR
jgi:hypothetical protein